MVGAGVDPKIASEISSGWGKNNKCRRHDKTNRFLVFNDSSVASPQANTNSLRKIKKECSTWNSAPILGRASPSSRGLTFSAQPRTNNSLPMKKQPAEICRCPAVIRGLRVLVAEKRAPGRNGRGLFAVFHVERFRSNGDTHEWKVQGN